MDFTDFKPEINENSDHFQDKDMVGNEEIDDTGIEAIPELSDSVDNFNDQVEPENNEIPASKDEVRDAIENEFCENKNLMAKLIKTTDYFINLYNLKEYLNSEDIVMEAVEDILTGKRKWYKNKCEKIKVFIIGVIKSKIRNYVNSNEYKKNKKIVPLYPSNLESENENTENSIYDKERAKYYNSDDEYEQPESEEFYNKVLGLFSDDINAYCVLDELLSSKKYNKKEQNQLLSKELGISVREVENAKKKIRYRLSTTCFPKNKK